MYIFIIRTYLTFMLDILGLQPKCNCKNIYLEYMTRDSPVNFRYFLIIEAVQNTYFFIVINTRKSHTQSKVDEIQNPKKKTHFDYQNGASHYEKKSTKGPLLPKVYLRKTSSNFARTNAIQT